MAWENQPVVVSSNNDISKKTIPSICLGIPHKGVLSANVFKSLYTVQVPPIYDMIMDSGSKPLDLTRNVIVSQVLQKKFEYLCFYDSDIVLPVDDMLLKLLKKRENVVGALYVSRADPEIVIGSAKGEKMLKTGDSEVVEGKTLEMDHLGMGFTLIHCGVFHTIGKKLKWRCLTNHKINAGGVVTLDYDDALDNNFSCPRCRELLVANFFFYTHGKFSGTEIWEDGLPIPVCSEDYFFCELAKRNGITPKLACDIPAWHEASGWLLGKDGIFTMQRGGGVV